MPAQLKNSDTYVTLNNGEKIPSVGLGTWKSQENDGYNSVIYALKAGYRHIDTAAIYRNEGEVGRAIKDSGVPRDQIFITTKLWCTEFQNPKRALESSLKRLGLDYVDLYLMHWPVVLNPRYIKDDDYLVVPRLPDGTRDVDMETWDYIKTWELVQELPATGLTRSVGVSNFSINNLEKVLSSPGNKLTPAVNQVELHPLLPQFELQKYCDSKKIKLEAYSPFGSDNAPNLKQKTIVDIAAKNGVSPAQVITSWIVQRDIVVLPKSVHEERVISNFKVFDLSKEDIAEIDALAKVNGEKRINKPDWDPFPVFE
ncbi:hypothetical protein TBLA_0A06510 [Henningerozyma blattae CBS 6284]|uniref:NADP-dependent oxidoreductase domain-containing protein n=1 Tax=Henningerozyma blattae (strain ATCC 34711 / CBS 6284 / DSM 70876 / NBRC 10599 / NRRL Y-10934 / UCD 77-7) TaxID=1071380 RepID=I2GWE1_HENB6|nr:hypothetical protein TBLA_0A06510 [Tetrapisispora blattae CBS 6284]CCH58443.1 hypothetical protein TBLA_0A06510 [Tetrapisispora blattae CBS 6284]